MHAQTHAADKELKEEYLPRALADYREQIVGEVINTVNSLNGGPITEGKVLEMLQAERETNTKAEVDALHQKIDDLLRVDIQKILDQLQEHKGELDSTLAYAGRIEKLVREHQALFDREDTEPAPLPPDEEASLGISTRCGLKLDKDGNLLTMTRR